MIEYKLDNIDWKILNILQSDAGISNIELADQVCPVSYTHLTLPTTPYV